jgi:hypothetical protein
VKHSQSMRCTSTKGAREPQFATRSLTKQCFASAMLTLMVSWLSHLFALQNWKYK